MAFFRQYIAPLLILVGFLVALVAVSARSFLPDDMLAPAVSAPVSPAPPVSQLDSAQSQLPRQLSLLVHGDAPAL